jgi:hypothetical protein
MIAVGVMIIQIIKVIIAILVKMVIMGQQVFKGLLYSNQKVCLVG